MNQNLNELEIYRDALHLGELVWDCVVKWDYLGKDSAGKQLVRSVDSIAINIAEGHGRFHFKENQKFCFYARCAVVETQVWLDKFARRNLIDKSMAREIHRDLEAFRKSLNDHIKSIGTKSDSRDS